MSAQGDTESALATLIEGAITGIVTTTGPIVPGKLESDVRHCSIRQIESAATRLDYGQNEWTERYACVFYWSHTIARATRIDELEAFQSAMLADQQLGEGLLTDIEDAYLAEKTWGEGAETNTVTCATVVELVRVE